MLVMSGLETHLFRDLTVVIHHAVEVCARSEGGLTVARLRTNRISSLIAKINHYPQPDVVSL